MKIICPDCKKAAALIDDFSFVKCSFCSLDMTMVNTYDMSLTRTCGIGIF